MDNLQSPGHPTLQRRPEHLRLLPFRNACMAQDNLEAHYDKNGSSYNGNTR